MNSNGRHRVRVLPADAYLSDAGPSACGGRASGCSTASPLTTSPLIGVGAWVWWAIKDGVAEAFALIWGELPDATWGNISQFEWSVLYPMESEHRVSEMGQHAPHDAVAPDADTYSQSAPSFGCAEYASVCLHFAIF